MPSYAYENTHYVIDDELFTALKACPPTGFPHDIPYRQPLQPPSTTTPMLTRPNWITATSPYLGFLPAVDVFKQYWLEPLRYSPSVEVEKLSNGMFILGSDVRKAWDLQERNMRVLLRSAMENSPDLSLPYPFTPLPYPRQYGYTKSYPSPQQVHAQARAAHDAFLPLIALINFIIHIMILHMRRLAHTNNRVLARHEWIHALTERSQIAKSWISYWVDTLVEGPFLGGYLDLSTFSSSQFFSVMETVNMPLVAYWGKDPYVANLSYTVKWQPDRALLRRLREHPRLPITKTTIPLETMCPEIEPGSGLRPKESMHGFFARRIAQREHRLMTETCLQRQSRESREDSSWRSEPPGKKGPRVYRWETDNGFRIRKAVDRAEVHKAWSYYGINQRRFDSVANEWDCCSEFGDLIEGDDDYDDGDARFLPQVFPDENFSIDSGYHSSVYIRSLEVPESSAEEIAYLDDSVEGVAYHRLGFVVSEQITHLHQQIPWQKIERMLGYGGRATQITFPTCVTTKERVSSFLCCIMAEDCNDDRNPMLDLNIQSTGIHDAWQFDVRLLNVHQGYYLLTEKRLHKDDLAPFILAISNATTVLEIVRRKWGPSLRTVTDGLMLSGTAFRTFVSSNRYLEPYKLHLNERKIKHNIVQEDDIQVTAKLGYREYDHVFTLEDYNVYIRERDAFLGTYRGRAAVLMGGIMARLAKTSVDSEDVLDGLTPDVDKEWGSGECFYIGSGDVAYWDDSLTEDEINLLCGVYDVAQGPPDTRGNISLVQKSWWPKPAIWRSSGLDCGYWSRDAENWFRSREDQIKDGERVKLMTKQEWRGNFKFTRDTVRLRERYEEVAKRYLDRRLTIYT
ncbi:hypothetical protein V5O48_010999 [Marasmius crinis-equi]|uniref:Uncharacterized protein n=1 Tax=Marasmius crinis-equi TaxID=585013 RepID=A0ABR3F7B5_9AGAR